jgi:hypothetical protein
LYEPLNMPLLTCKKYVAERFVYLLHASSPRRAWLAPEGQLAALPALSPADGQIKTIFADRSTRQLMHR